MSALILDGKEISAQVRREVAGQVEAFKVRHGRAPSLHVILAGDDPASAVYVRNKEKAAKEVGIDGAIVRLPANVTEAELISRVRALAVDPRVDGILVQLPLPKGSGGAGAIDEQRVLDLVPPEKDVDGFHPLNAGLLSTGRPGLVACTPLGCMRMIEEAERLLATSATPFTLAGADAVVVGRSNIVGKPVAQLLLAKHATVTIAHSRTRDLAGVCRRADVLVVAIGRAEAIKGAWVKEGAVVVDVGINRVVDSTGKARLVGDVEFEAARARAAAITPVPGGVGPMTIALLLQNTVRAAEARLSAIAGSHAAPHAG